ncbi:unnamed protein product [Chrysoparadoxa australica]
MGVSYAEPFRFDYSDSGEELPSVAACAKMAALRNRISEKAKTVVVGGGVTGIEVACEIIEAFPGKEVTLVHSRPRLLNDEPRASDKDAAAIKLKLEKKGITVTLNTRYDFDAAPDDTAVIRAAGGKPATQFLDPTMLDDKGFVKVDDYLRLNDHPNIFVAGDLISGRPKKVVNSTMLTAPVVVSLPVSSPSSYTNSTATFTPPSLNFASLRTPLHSTSISMYSGSHAVSCCSYKLSAILSPPDRSLSSVTLGPDEQHNGQRQG